MEKVEEKRWKVEKSKGGKVKKLEGKTERKRERERERERERDREKEGERESILEDIRFMRGPNHGWNYSHFSAFGMLT